MGLMMRRHLREVYRPETCDDPDILCAKVEGATGSSPMQALMFRGPYLGTVHLRPTDLRR
jgi:hypothetical protein